MVCSPQAVSEKKRFGEPRWEKLVFLLNCLTHRPSVRFITCVPQPREACTTPRGRKSNHGKPSERFVELRRSSGSPCPDRSSLPASNRSPENAAVGSLCGNDRLWTQIRHYSAESCSRKLQSYPASTSAH